MKEDNVLQILKSLMSIPGPSTGEEMVVKQFLSYLDDHVDEKHTDWMGNGWGILNPEGEKTILFIAHADEIGFIVQGIDPSGFVKALPLGALPLSYAQGLAVEIHCKDRAVNGIIGRPSVHLALEEKGKDTLEPLYIDIGSKSLETASSLVSPGDLVSCKRRCLLLEDGHVCGVPLDNRTGLTALIQASALLETRKSNFRIVLAASVQEETGYKGGRGLIEELSPDFAVVIDVVPATDYPESKGRSVEFSNIKLGSGSVIHVGPDSDRRFSREIVSSAKTLPFQLWVSEGMTPTESTAIHQANPKTRIGIIGIPCRYTHSFYEVASLDDIRATGKLIAEIASHTIDP